MPRKQSARRIGPQTVAARGIKCARCAGRHGWVYCVRRADGRIVRCRECRACGYRQRTVERVAVGE